MRSRLAERPITTILTAAAAAVLLASCSDPKASPRAAWLMVAAPLAAQAPAPPATVARDSTIAT